MYLCEVVGVSLRVVIEDETNLVDEPMKVYPCAFEFLAQTYLGSQATRLK